MFHTALSHMVPSLYGTGSFPPAAWPTGETYRSLLRSIMTHLRCDPDPHRLIWTATMSSMCVMGLPSSLPDAASNILTVLGS